MDWGSVKFSSALCRWLSCITVVILLQMFQSYGSNIISLGSSLYAVDHGNSSWTSPSGDFAFGFYRLPGGKERYVLAIWFAKIPDKTVVWSADGVEMERGSKVELTTTGQLVLTTPGEKTAVWRTENLNNMTPTHAAILDTGNFVIAHDWSTGDFIWESFKHPTDTILPTQELRLGDQLSSVNIQDYRPGKFQLFLARDGNLTVSEVNTVTRNPYAAYYSIFNVSALVFNQSGNIQVVISNGSVFNLTGTAPGMIDNFYHRATLNFDGTFTKYSHPKTSIGTESWEITETIPDNICLSIYGYYGSGPCGYNSICRLGSSKRPDCECPPGFSLLDPENEYSGCKQSYTISGSDCDRNGLVIKEDRFYFATITSADWPLAGYEQLQPSNESDCQKRCLVDCKCEVAIFRNSTGECWKKRLPLSNGRHDENVDRIAFFRILKPGHTPELKSYSHLILILSVFLGTSLFFNLLCVATVTLAAFCLCKRKRERCRVSTSRRDLDMNLRYFTYQDLEEATGGFKEKLGHGAFGTVYRGLLAAAGSANHYIAVKKLNKIVQEGEKEFRTEVSAIGQTHHRNLVRLLGYCDEDEHRILVYEFMHNGSLSGYLFGDSKPSWQQRLQIASGIARGLMYLHEECSTKIIHCDIKPQNILLDSSFTAKISDFGLAKVLINDQTRTLTVIRGTKGYVAPEWFRNTPITVKVDVYSFGVMLLEIICCRKSVSLEMENDIVLTDWVYECFTTGRLEKLVEDDEEARRDFKRLEKLVMVAIWCVQDEPQLRPSMRAVTLMLEGVTEVSAPPCPFLSSSASTPC